MRGRKGSSHTATHAIFDFWLVFEEAGGLRLTRSEPNLDRSERAMFLRAKLPRSLWQIPTLRGSINVSPTENGGHQVDLAVAGEAIKAALGVDIDLRFADQTEAER